jgi:hypothetical protein
MHPQNVTPDVDSVPLLRLERAHVLESTCVLLSANGHYHLERHVPRKVRVFEGHLDDTELREIVRIISGDLLFRLQQKQIPDLMLKSDDEKVILQIHRPEEWQHLFFPDSKSREPFHEAMEPLLKWLDSVNKRKSREFSEEAARNNCLPPGSNEFAKRPPHRTDESRTIQPGNDPMTSLETPAEPHVSYTLLMYETRMFNYQPQVTCLVISATGEYHMVTQSKTNDNDKGMENAVLDGILAPPQLSALRSILDAPEFIRQPEEQHVGEIMMTSDGYFTRLYIPRGQITQNFAAWKSYRIVNQIMSRSVEDHGTKTLAPFREWMDRNIDRKKANPVAIPPNPRCIPGG